MPVSLLPVELLPIILLEVCNWIVYVKLRRIVQLIGMKCCMELCSAPPSWDIEDQLLGPAFSTLTLNLCQKGNGRSPAIVASLLALLIIGLRCRRTQGAQAARRRHEWSLHEDRGLFPEAAIQMRMHGQPRHIR